MKTVFEKTCHGIRMNDELTDQVFGSLVYNNTFFPNIDRIIFNTGENTDKKSGETYKTLATIVFFKDGTKCSVVNSIHDKVDNLETAKETGLVYCMAKRLMGSLDEKGNVHSNGFGQKIRKWVNKGFCQQEEAQRVKEEKQERKQKHLERLRKDEDKKNKPTLITETTKDTKKENKKPSKKKPTKNNKKK